MISGVTHIKRAAVFGSGAFGTALACVLAKKSERVSVWHMNAAEARKVNEKHENVFFLPGAPLPRNIEFTADAEECATGAEIVLFVIPTQFLRGFMAKNGHIVRKHVVERNVPVVMCSKGIERSSLLFPAQILAEFLPNYPIGVIAGPSFAIEVAKGMLTNVCAAATDINMARKIQSIMTTDDGSFRCWATTDVIGCEIASAMKNVLAIASGVLKGLGTENNARATLISRGVLEIRDLTLALGGTGEAVFGLPGLGDLLLTCSSELSRNFTVGMKLGRGMSLEEIKRTSKAVAEGVATAEPLERLAKKYNVRLPICHEVYRVLYEGGNAKEAYKRLNTCALADEGLPALPRASKL
ncbi:putative NAD dependent glycerol 3 phosphate dehydrogenase [Trypanosoma vivax]|uniref:Glycerol-3-phosphate dehydrogenase [NAD(+)] n=1 Tax=Trypanosoma vivax (strain Y486) TaxID=1055687 RepID=G0U0T4_TRYVY|nr:putative NAD dependent glycerol 3 phosphate dehydrogenase [Trypanosoma vivax]CCC49684.1 putative glycerol-3-phosphate dehydrogenase [NAD+],glycosomal [Trypanosoma vivax Y486]